MRERQFSKTESFLVKLTYIIHHSHYFSFVYCFWLLLDKHYIKYANLYFFVGWILYYLANYLSRKYAKTTTLVYSVYGHIVTGFSILMMGIFKDNIFIMTMWFITGFGGGSCYVFRDKFKGIKEENAENIGRVFGCFIAMMILIFYKLPELVVIFSSILALLTAVMMLYLYLQTTKKVYNEK